MGSPPSRLDKSGVNFGPSSYKLPHMQTEQLPWLFALLTGAWFGWMASRAGRSKALWAVGGAAFGLVLSTIVIGLGRASSIPYSQHHAQMDRFWSAAIAALVILGVGWLLTASLHRHRMAFEQQTKMPPTAPPPSPEAKTANPQPKPPGRPAG